MSSNLGQAIVQRWAAGLSQVEITGLSFSARAYATVQVLLETKKNCVLVCPTSDDALRMYDDIKNLLNIFRHTELISMVDLFCGWDQSPYRPYHPSLNNRIRRMRTLHKAQLGLSRLIVTDVESIAQKCAHPNDLSQHTILLKKGDLYPVHELEARLNEMGYQKRDPVEDPGSFVSRGYIFDVFSPSSKRPLRIEFFGDEVETIRTFDPTSQRTDMESLDHAHVFSVQDWEFSNKTIEPAKSKIKTFCDEYGVPKQSRDRLFERFDAGVRDLTDDYLWTFFADRSAWLLDYVPEWTVVVNDSLGVDQRFDELSDELKDDFDKAIAQGQIVAPVADLFISQERFNDIKSKAALMLNSVALNLPEEQTLYEDTDDETRISSDFRVRCLTNSDLRSATSDAAKHSLDAVIEKETQIWGPKNYLRALVTSTESQAERAIFLLSQKAVACRKVDEIDAIDTSHLQVVSAKLTQGFRLPIDRLALITDSEIFGEKKVQKERQKKTAEEDTLGTFISSLEDLVSGDLVVHTTHGIGKYSGLTKLKIDNVPQDFLLIEYQGADKLYLPIYRLDQVQKYIGTPETVTLDKLGTAHFEKAKAKVKAALKDLAAELLQLYAKRATRDGFAFSAPDDTYKEFEAKFPYAETTDQLKAIDAALDDMQAGKIMDRLVCGDVGYGKTEVAIRAAFKAVLDGKQVAVLVPTTILCFQHERSFKERLKDYPISITSVSRFKSAKQNKDALERLKEGKLDIIIGTHRLLSKDVQFKDLGLVIIDEEHRFGVEHKEKLKILKTTAAALTLTATPIPRTLQMSLMGLRDISVINTPPVDRLSIRTYVSRFDEEVIGRAITQELARGGQVYFVHNRVQSIEAMYDKLQSVVPQARILIGHGQLDERELEKRMLDFYEKKYDVLLCSTIIESGIDIPTANTIIINRADTFGLAQLYQLRGRVGRSQQRGYCYLLIPEEGSITEIAKRRLEIIQRFVDLGSGFKIASHDLELRGGGDVLGKSQSGHIASIGFELYTDLLDETIRTLKGEEVQDRFDPEIKLPVAALIPENYVPDISQRLSLYKRMSQAADDKVLQDIELELQDRYGKLPEEAKNLMWLIRLKQLLMTYRIKSLVAGRERSAIDAGDQAKLSPKKTIQFCARHPYQYSINPDSKIIIKQKFESAQKLYEMVHTLISQVAETHS